MTTYYDMLGLAPDASSDDIRRAFRREAKRLHPDRAQGVADEMVRLNEAYETLRSPERREAYDQTLARPGYRLPPRPPREASTPSLDPLEYKLRVFLPLDRALALALRAIEQAVEELAYDVYDDRYVEAFATALDAAEAAALEAHRRLFSAAWPGPLTSPLNLYRQGVRQLDDALEDFRAFTLNFDSDALVTGRALLALAEKLLNEARGYLRVA